MKLLICCFLLLSIFLTSCDSDSSFESVQFKTVDSTTNLIDSLDIFQFVKKYKNSYDDIPFTFKVDGKRFFMPIIGSYSNFYNDKSHFELIGLIDDSNKTILPIEYELIYTPNVLLDNTFEVRKNGKQGLVSLTGEVILEAKYDIIYPGFDDHLVCFKEGGKYGYLDTEYQLNDVKLDETNTFLRRLFSSKSISKWKFTLDNQIVFRDIKMIERNIGDVGEGCAYLCPPSYLAKLGVVEEELTNVLADTNDRFGVFRFESEIETVSQNKEGFWLMVSKTFTEVSDARGVVEESKVVTVLDKFNVPKYAEITQEKDFNLCNDTLVFRKVNDSIFEAKFSKWGKGAFQSMERYVYFKMEDQGIIKHDSSNRIFEFTEHVIIDSTYFTGCWRKYLQHNDSFNMLVYNHLLVEDLDIMRNEIFATHGYKFKSEYWNTYFKQFKWYKPQFENVDDKLNTIEKENIQFILNYKDKMIENEFETQVDSINWAPAG